MLPTHYLEPIILVFHCLRLDNWHAVDYAVNLQSCQIQPSVSPKLLHRFLLNLYILCLTYTQLHISNLKEIASIVLEIFVPENCPIFFTFFSSHKITSIFKSHKNNLPILRFLSN